MKSLFAGIALVAFGVTFSVMAQHSTITDRDAGWAENIIETGNVIHVYHYLGGSSEAWASTFDEGEDWSNFTWTPQPAVYTNNALRHRANTATVDLNQVSPIVQMIDECLEAGKTWDHSENTCYQGIIWE